MLACDDAITQQLYILHGFNSDKRLIDARH